ncbi:phosphotransferase family protein [Tumebacillus sp. DT12]|uniref:Phosphotransferase family protein n=1 Tax=Tumebacillus lacus TaxID=2995335 RepID=A0ABT3X261_9BACL|nr:phosphotransferase family protein [Tumebacillus lacus]MCX7570999.1 phosphotransferase family protein [Tumebacillus lacus]
MSEQQRTRETIPVRAGEELDLARLTAYLGEHVPELASGDWRVEQFAAGHSNLTYLLRDGEREAVLRRPPLGPVAPKAHDMGRESRLLAALSPLFAKAPRPYLFCEDTAVIGSPFFVMERKKGVVADRRWPVEYEQTEENARLMSEALIDTLVELHSVEWRGTGLAEIGRPDGYMQRQVAGWIERYERSKTDEIPEAALVAKKLTDGLPESPTATIVHNDLKLNNLLLDEKDPSRVTAVLDWEMATLGDPLSDLAITLSYWAEASDPEVLRQGLSPLTTRPGFYTREQLIHRYALKSGRSVEQMDFYMAFATFKIAVICQQIYFRWKQGQTQDPRFAGMGAVAAQLIKVAAKS